MISTVETATGPVDTAALGVTLIHEHVFLVDTELERNFPTLAWNGQRRERVADAVVQLQALKSKGVDTIVDMTVIGLGRQVDTIIEVARQVDLKIILTTGVYLGRGMPDALTVRDPGDVPHARRSEDALADLFIRDITTGIGTTSAKAGVIKGYTNQNGLTPETDRCLRAVAFAHRSTGVPINTHSDPVARTGLDQLRVFEEEGVDLERVIIGHSGDTVDLNYLKSLMDKGATIASDRFGLYMDGRPSARERVDVIVALVEGGYADRITLSHDSHCYADFSDIEGSAFSRDVYPDWVHGHIVDAIVPALLTRGITDEQVSQMMVENPRRMLERREAY